MEEIMKHDAPQELTHYTWTIDALASILKNGFLYLHCERKVAGKIFREVYGLGEPVTGGMICFTEIDHANSRKHQEQFGSYGISLAGDWVVSNGGRKVTYVPLSGDLYENYKRNVLLHAPRHFDGADIFTAIQNESSAHLAKLLLTERRFAASLGAHPKYIEALSSLEWTQTDQDVAQREWRIWNPHGYAGIQHLPKGDQVSTLLRWISDPRINHMGTEGLSLKFDWGAVKHLICPAKDVQSLRSILLDFNYPLVPILYANE